MNVLGISTSHRAWGNTDLLALTALKAAAEEGASVRLLRPAEWNLKPCIGCMRCLFKGSDCVLGDRLGELLDAMRRADALVLCAPTYVLSPNAVLKIIQDRTIRFGLSRELAGKAGMAAATAGVRGWEGFSVAQLTGMLLFYGVTVVDRFTGYGQGPGEILDDAPSLARAARAGRALARGETAFLGEPGLCPHCTLSEVVPAPGGGARCNVCDVPGRLEGGRFLPDPSVEPRFSEAKMKEHFTEKVLASGPRFKAEMKGYAARVAAFRRSIPSQVLAGNKHLD